MTHQKRGFSIRLAQSDDAAALVKAIRRVWPKSDVVELQVHAALINEQHATFVAEDESGHLVGFVDGFSTVDRTQAVRWEIDLVGVVPSAQGYGLGTALIEAAVDVGLLLQPRLARALIKIENTASIRAFQRNGFAAQAESVELFVFRNGSFKQNVETVTKPAALHTVDVLTMYYRGLWLKADYSREALAYSIQQYGCSNMVIGTTIPAPMEVEQQAARELGFRHVDTYRWWVLPLDE